MESEERVEGAVSGSPSSKAKITIANEPQEAVIVFNCFLLTFILSFFTAKLFTSATHTSTQNHNSMPSILAVVKVRKCWNFSK
jgi:hypothetical protein